MTTTMPSSVAKIKDTMVERIESAQDPRIAAFRGVADPDLVRGRRQFIAEGRLVVRRVVEEKRYRVRAVLVNDAALAQLEGALATLPSHTEMYVCDTAVFGALTGYHIHRGCLALVDRPEPRPLETVARDAGASVVVLEGVGNADNVGAVFRNAAAFGCGGVVLSPTCCDPYYRKAIRTSMGAVLGVPFAIAAEWPDALHAVRDAGFTIAALTPREPAVTLDALVRQRPPRVALVAGTEGAGLSAEVEALADVRVRIPIADAVDSLNVATAVAIALSRLATSD
jgi:tRNA G18 (ribose-2'-O)-methylase SpoU